MIELQTAAQSTPAETCLALAVRHAAERSEKRQTDRERIHASVVHPIDTPRSIPDPLERRESRLVSTMTTARLLVAATVIHVLAIFLLFVINQLVGRHSQFRPPDRVKVRIVETPPPVEPPPVEEFVALKGPVEPDFKPLEPEPAVPKKKPKMPKPVEPPPELPDAPEPPPEPVRHRIVGLSMESTVQGGGGPSFAVGTSRMGKTARRAADPKQASKEPTVTGTARPGHVQRVAARIPTRDAVFVKPKRLPSTKPPYPDTLKARNVEGDVLMRVDIDRAGEVIRAEVLRGSGFREFDEASRKASLAERFTPATRDGRPVAYTLSYTYRFRIEEY